MIIEQKSAGDIGRYGFAHYSGCPVNPEAHELLLVPQSIADGWEGLCGCGEWRAFTSFYDYPERDALLAAIRERHASHVAEGSKALSPG